MGIKEVITKYMQYSPQVNIHPKCPIPTLDFFLVGDRLKISQKMRSSKTSFIAVNVGTNEFDTIDTVNSQKLFVYFPSNDPTQMYRILLNNPQLSDFNPANKVFKITSMESVEIYDRVATSRVTKLPKEFTVLSTRCAFEESLYQKLFSQQTPPAV